QRGDSGDLVYRYWRCTAAEKVPMQQASWRRAELVLAPSTLAPLPATLESPHEAQIDGRLWDALYDTGLALDLTGQPDLAAVLRYHHDAIARSMAVGADWATVTRYSAPPPSPPAPCI